MAFISQFVPISLKLGIELDENIYVDLSFVIIVSETTRTSGQYYKSERSRGKAVIIKLTYSSAKYTIWRIFDLATRLSWCVLQKNENFIN